MNILGSVVKCANVASSDVCICTFHYVCVKNVILYLPELQRNSLMQTFCLVLPILLHRYMCCWSNSNSVMQLASWVFLAVSLTIHTWSISCGFVVLIRRCAEVFFGCCWSWFTPLKSEKSYHHQWWIDHLLCQCRWWWRLQNQNIVLGETTILC